MTGATSVHPISDLLLWARFALGAAVVLWLPGHLLAARHLANRGRLPRVVIALGLGALLLPLWAQATSLLGLGVRPWQYLPPILLATALFGATEPARRLGRALDRDTPDAPWLGPALLGSVGLGALVLGLGFGEFVVPPTTHDAANHAFMTLRIGETGNVVATEVFGPPYGRPDLPYALGLHAIASMIAQTSGLAPYVAVWMLALAAVALIPAAFALLWDDWGFPAVTVALAALLVAANPYSPSRLLWWGLFGTAAGLFLVPHLSLLLFRFWSSATLVTGLAAGAATGSLMLIHGSEVPTAGLVTLATIAIHRQPPALRAQGWLAFVVATLVCGWLFLGVIVPAYLEGGIESGDEFLEPLRDSLARTLSAIGEWPHLQAAGVFGVVVGFLDRRTRVVCVFGLALVALVTALSLWRDPVSSLLTTPYYRQPERVRYQLAFVVPVLTGAGLVWAWTRARAAEWPRHTGPLAAVLLVAALVLPELPGTVRRFHSKDHFAPFSPDDYAQAEAIAALVEDDEWVLNQFFDGSSWAMHLSGEKFLVPTGWRLRNDAWQTNRLLLRRVLAGAPFAQLDARFAYLYVSDLRTGAPRGFTRTKADRNPALEPVLVGEHSTVYRIRRDGVTPIRPPR